ncbi:glycosyltransferase family 4 protein [Paenibacillus methanolicus]|uniref:Glycosyltransferase involved in cell wall biosynthesis n=1 Tax=Paenibacillus methanolicus TaxID=582686 RepID=A0A5S5CI04_9BACL|nr:glycosyltransferase family 4 protein [Paenibacillus methanolicus]TYP78132.1 glycosyltransferase involved in cell wall biosynthesis [Paenibacillus methanolicus]
MARTMNRKPAAKRLIAAAAKRKRVVSGRSRFGPGRKAVSKRSKRGAGSLKGLKAATRKRRQARFAISALPVPALSLPEVSRYVPAPPNERQLSGAKLSILYLVHGFFPESYTGTEKFVLNMAKEMQRRGHRVKVAAYSRLVPEEAPLAFGDVLGHEYEFEGIPVLAYRHRGQDPAQAAGFGDHSLLALAESMLIREQPNLLHVGHAMRGMEFVQAARNLGIPYVMTLTDFWFACPRSNLLRVDKQLCAGPEGGVACMTHCQIPYAADRLNAQMPLLLGASRIVAPSVFLASFVKQALPALPIEVLPHGIRQETVVPNAKRYGKSSPITLIYGGSLNEHKGVHVLIAALAKVPSRRLRLHIYGSGEPVYEAAIRRAAARDSRISFLGPYAEGDIPRLYQEADMAAVPSVWYENYPLALHEALAAHVPVLTSNIGGMAEKIVDGLNGYTFRAGDARHLAERIRMVARDPALLNGLKDNIRAMPLPDVGAEADAYESIYYAHARS